MLRIEKNSTLIAGLLLMAKTLEQIESECREAYKKHIDTGINDPLSFFEDTKAALKESSFSDEEKIILSTTYLAGMARFGHFIVTDKKCVLIKPVRLLNYEADSFYFDKISTASTQKNFGNPQVQLRLDSGKKINFFHSKCKKVVDVILEAMSEYKKPVTKITNTSDENSDDILERLEKLFNLYEKNAITKEEYELLKSKLINE